MWKCEKLNVTTQIRPCETRKKMNTFACIGCKGAEKMAAKLCIVKGCTKQSQGRVYDEMCKAHFTESKQKKVTKTQVKVQEQPEPVKIIQEKDGITMANLNDKIDTSEIFCIHAIQVIRDKKQADLDAEMLKISTRLNAINNDYDKIKFIFEMVPR